jgi:hypothetical protein
MSPTKPRHRIAVKILIPLGVVLTVLAIFAVWTERQALDTDEWVDTSSALLEDPAIQSALTDYLTNELFTNVDVQAELADRLPAQVAPLAGPLAGALRELATEVAARALESSKVQDVWASANRTAHELLLNLIDGNGELVDAQGGVVTLQLQPLVSEIASRLGISADVASKIPDDVASLEIIRSDQIEAAQKIAKLIKGLAIVLSVLALGSFALAIFLARDRRQTTVLWCGVGLIVAGVLVLVLREAAGDAVVNGLAKTESANEAAAAAWSIATSLMTSIAKTVIVYGVLFVLASWVASPSPSGAAIRRSFAPTLRDRPVLVYGLVVAAALIYFALAPTHGVRALVTLAFLVALALFGLTALRRQAAEEFPDAQAGDTRARLREWASRRGRPEAPAATGADADEERLQRLERLRSLHADGTLSDEELAAEKARILA